MVPRTPFVSVVVVTWNGRHYLDGCLGALRRQTHRHHEVVLVDNGSTDDSVEFVRERYPEVRLLQSERNLGFVGGNLLGLRQARGDWLALLNNDTVVEPDWLAALLDAARPSDVAGATGKVFALDEPERCIFTVPLIDRHTGRAIWTNAEFGVTEAHYLSGNNMLVKRRVLDEVGPLDPDYYSYYEETDWCARMIRAGYRLMYTPHARLRHKELGSTRLERHRYFMERNHLRFVLKNFDADFLARFLPLYLAQFARHYWRGDDGFGTPMRPIMRRALRWNLHHLGATLRARRRDLGRLPRHRSYNRSLPVYTL
jgi:GT2 family glycosyltransferase